MTVEEKREKTRLRNIAWRKNNPSGYLNSAAKYRKNNPHKLKEYKLKVRYGISQSKYNEMLQIQNNKCAICEHDEVATHNFSKRKQNLAVDHCHKSKKVRGLLCQDCNRGLGLFHEDISRLKKAIDYLCDSDTMSRCVQNG